MLRPRESYAPLESYTLRDSTRAGIFVRLVVPCAQCLLGAVMSSLVEEDPLRRVRSPWPATRLHFILIFSK